MRKRLRKAARWGGILLVLFAAFAGGTAILWFNGTLQPWLRARLVQAYVATVAPHLPFEIERVETRQSWRELLSGRISDLSLVLRWGPLRVRLAGQVDLRRSDKQGVQDLTLAYTPQVTLEPVAAGTADRAAPEPERSPALPLVLRARLAPQKTAVLELGAYVQTAKWSWLGAELEAPQLAIHWQEESGQLRIAAEWKALSWSEGESRSINLEAWRLSAQAPLALQPFALGRIDFEMGARSLEALFGEQYYDVPASLLQLRGRMELPADTTSASLSVGFGAGEGPRLTLSALVPTSPGPDRPVNLEWRLPSQPLPPLLEAVRKTAPHLAIRIPSIDLRQGRVSAEGALTIDPSACAAAPSLALQRARLDLDRVDVDWKEQALALRGFSGKVRYDGRAATGSVETRAFYFRKLKGSLGATELDFTRVTQGKEKGRWNVTIPVLPLKLEDIPLDLGGVIGHFLTDQPGWGIDFELATHLKVLPVPAATLAKAFCLPTDALPPATFQLDFPQLDLSPGIFNPTGFIELALLGGKLRIEEMGGFDLLTAVPELDFNLELKGLRLDELGKWLGFGEMDGTLELSATDVTFQSWLPTHYDFRAEVKPLNRWKVVFSPEAMKNFVKLFSGPDIEQLPGIADWIAFGWPSRVLGGYDVFYAGLSLLSSDGRIVVRTLDPPNILARERKHFILYGPRFKMPLQSPHYPLVVDATSMSNYLRRMALQLGSLKKTTPEAASGAHNPQEKPHAACLPEVF